MTTLKDSLKPGDHGSTFGGNYLSTSAANEVMDILSEYKNSGDLDEDMIYFEKKLKELLNEFGKIIEKDVGLGMMRGLRLKSGEILNEIVNGAFEEGVLLLKAGKNTLRFLPPLTISKEEMDEGFKRVRAAFKKIK